MIKTPTPTRKPSPAPALDFRCECGAVRAVLHDAASRRGRRLVCHCHDCQVFAHYLGREKEMLDDQAGTPVYRTEPAQFEITEGRDRIACVRLSGKPALRWYCADCRTPVAISSASPRFAWLSLVLTGFDPAKTDALLGADAVHVAVRSGAGDLGKVRKAGLTDRLAMLRDTAARNVKALAGGGDGKSPLFDAKTGEPVAVPVELSRAERLALDEQADIYRDVLAELG